MGEPPAEPRRARLGLTPPLIDRPEPRKVLRAVTRSFALLAGLTDADERRQRVAEIRHSVLMKRGAWPRPWRQRMVAMVEVLADLLRLGWDVEVSRSRILLLRPSESSHLAQRDVRRGQLHAQRELQLREPTTRAFVRDMEHPPSRAMVGSVFRLMRDGRDLARRLDGVRRMPGAEATDSFCQVVKPYLAFVDETAVCSETGLRLMDIWRYFRHTWANPYQSVPGRSMAFLVRDAAALGHPVMGVAAISSAAVQMTSRDQFIGWQAESFVDWVAAAPTDRVAQWAVASLAGFIDEIYQTDFIARSLFTPRRLLRPTAKLIEALEARARAQRARHQELMRGNEYKKDSQSVRAEDEHWEHQASLPLFKAKRASELASLLRLRLIFNKAFGERPSAEGLRRLLALSEGRSALGGLARKAKAKRVGVAIADLTVCGALPPYSSLLGGKLVAALATSPEVVAQYRQRYGAMASVIASSMAGRPIVRDAALVLIGTTSLYGVRPSQYDRIAVPADCIGGPPGATLKYHFLEHTKGQGTFQFSETTVRAISLALRQSSNGLTVNSVFGEGANPRLRKLREGLALLGFPVSELLTHGLDKLVYAVPLVKNAREYLLGLDAEPDYLFALTQPKVHTTSIARWWAGRWAIPRLARPGTLDELAVHTLTYPIRHGARVVVPDEADSGGSMFEW